METLSEDKDNGAAFVDKRKNHSATLPPHSTTADSTSSSSSGSSSSNNSRSRDNSNQFTRRGSCHSHGDPRESSIVKSSNRRSSNTSSAARTSLLASTTGSSSSSTGSSSSSTGSSSSSHGDADSSSNNTNSSESVSCTRSSNTSRTATSSSSTSSSSSNNGSQSNSSAERDAALSHEDDPYSRLLALQRMGVVKSYAAIREKTVAVVGVGGVGAVAAEMLTRCGLGRLLLFDCDRVEAGNMNRLFFRPYQIGLPKVQAARETLLEINSDVDIQIFDCDISKDFDVLLSCLTEQRSDATSSSTNISSSTNLSNICHPTRSVNSSSSSSSSSNSSSGSSKASSGNSRSESSMNVSSSSSSDSSSRRSRGVSEGKPAVDLLLSCVDNYAARITISQACNETGVVWMNSGVSESATSGQIQTIIPGLLACFQCAPPYIVATGGDERGIRREGVCAASLPTTTAVVAGLLVQNALKYLLHFGDVSPLLSFDSIRNFFYPLVLQPNPLCADPWCQQQQRKAKEDGLSVSAFLHFPVTAPLDSTNNGTPPEHASTAIRVLAEGDEGEPFLPLINTTCSDVKSRKSDGDGADSRDATGGGSASGNSCSNSTGGRDSSSQKTSGSNFDTIRISNSTHRTTQIASELLIASEAGDPDTEAGLIAGRASELQKCSVEQLREELKRLQS